MVHPGDDHSAGAATRDPQPALPVSEAIRRLASLDGGWRAMRPGSNFYPLTVLDTPLGIVDGEMLETLFRQGLIEGAPVGSGATKHSLKGGRINTHETIPDVDLDWRWHLSDGALGRQDDTLAKGSV